MTEILKCPICGKDLIEIQFGKRWFLACDNSKCRCKGVASYVVWEHIDRTRKALDVATWFIKGISQTAINDCDNQYVVLGNFKKFAQDTLNQIKTALEQKEQQ